MKYTHWALDNVTKFVSDCGCEFLSDTYGKSKDRYKFKCKCGEIFETAFDTFHRLNKRTCNKCSGWNIYEKFTIEYAKLIAEKNNCELLDDIYVNAKTKCSFKCSCGKIFKTDFDKFIHQNKTTCNMCASNVSKGEVAIKQWLDDNHITNSKEYGFKDLTTEVGGKPRFDFATFDKDNKLVMLIEFDGKQHFKPIKTWGGKEALGRRQYLDKLKSDYCELHNIPLLRIKYTEFYLLEDILGKAVITNA